MKHTTVLGLLYEYAANELSAVEKQKVGQHLASCSSCSNELKELQQAMALLPDVSAETPSDSRDEVFWHSLARNIEQEIRTSARPKPSLASSIIEKITMLFTLRPGYAYAIGGSVAALFIAVLLFRWAVPEKPRLAEDQAMPDSSIMFAHARNQERIGQYFRKSKTLLIGIANLKTDDTQNLDLSLERKISRDLIRETRYIKYQPINSRTEKLVRDLEKILIELANTEEATDLPNVELIRSGIHQENLLFKIRMAEASFESAGRERIY